MQEIARRTLLALGAAAGASAAVAADDPTEIVPLWPGPPPGAPNSLPRTKITDRTATSGFLDRYATEIGEPLMTVFRPKRPNGAALLIAPGGGYVRVVIDKEGFEVARRVAEAGITAFVLRYRLPGEGWAAPAVTPLQDAQRALRLIRAGARSYDVDPARVAVLGASAGGHVAGSLATGWFAETYAPVDAADRESAKPMLAALLYPVVDMSLPYAHVGSREALLGRSPSREREIERSVHRQVRSDTPPTFLVHALDDTSVPAENTLQLLAALRAAKVATEAHLFEEGGHGFGIHLAQGKPAAAWPDLFLAWAARRGLLRG